jgi:formate dehydrogenase iron-sulfur subunit
MTDTTRAPGSGQDALSGWDALRAAGNLLSGPEADPARDAGHLDPPPRMGFFTDTSVCIGCKACEVACKEWNAVPAGNGAGADGASDFTLTGMSYDNSVGLGASTWRHVAFIEQSGVPQPPAPDGRTELPLADADAGADAHADASAGGDGMRWLMASDVCKHCTHAACLDVCPTGSLFRTEFGTVVVQEDICNGCGYCVPACPYGVIEQRPADGRAFKCTLCYDRLSAGQEPACAKACPTESIQFGPLDELRERADRRVRQLTDAGVPGARLYGHEPGDGVGGDGAFFLLLDEPEVYGLPPDPVVTTRDLPAMWRHAGAAALSLLAGIAVSFASDALTGRSAGRPGRRR